jgi:hypothetical protein
MPPTPAPKHWSNVQPGQEFDLILDWDPKTYASASVSVRLRRNITSGCTESTDPRWPWAPKNSFGDGKAKLTAAAKASGIFTPPFIGGGGGGQAVPLMSFFRGSAVAACEPTHHEPEWLVPFLRSSKSKLPACKGAELRVQTHHA